MDVKTQQLACAEQEAVLRGLALAAAGPKCRFLEVGSWCGDSTVILADIARDFGGQLFCIDWWKGNAGTELADIADRDDVFSRFWHRICRAGLEDFVIPLRGRSEVVMPTLRENFFHLVFLDADHRYQQVKRDIRNAIPLVHRHGGILCGHDCEGLIGDFDAEFLAAGKDMDCHESVHCGVVCAVGEAFADIALQHSIWSVRANGHARGWEPTNLNFPGLAQRRQSPPPSIAATSSHNLLRYGRRVYAVPHSQPDVDVTDESQRNFPGILSAPTMVETAKLAREEEHRAAEERQRLTPSLHEEGYCGFNIVAYAGRYYALSQDIGPVDIPSLPEPTSADLQRQSRLFIADSLQQARQQVANRKRQKQVRQPG